MSKIIGIIPARYESSRFPGKPLIDIYGKSLIQRTYENARQCADFSQVIVATDDQRIFDHVKRFGGHVVMTSANCATGTDRLIEVIQKNFIDADIIINVQGDEPLLEEKVIHEVIEVLRKDTQASMSTAIMKMEDPEEILNPSVVKCVTDIQGNALYFSRSPIPGNKHNKVLPTSTYYKHLGIYGYRKEFLLHYGDIPQTPLQLSEDLEQLKVLENGYRIKTVIVNSQSIGVDTPEDLKKIELLWKQNLFL